MATFYTGNTGGSTGEHLDFRVWDVNKGGYTDPSRFTSYMKVGDQQLTDLFSVTSGYGMREHPVKGGQRMHYGIDYATPTGTAVTISGGKYLGTFNDSGGGGITSQYSITDADGNPYEIMLMHGSDQNKITMDGANTTGQPIGGTQDPAKNPSETVKPVGDASTAKERAQNYANMSKSEINAAYDAMRNDPAKASIEGMKMHNAFFKK